MPVSWSENNGRDFTTGRLLTPRTRPLSEYWTVSFSPQNCIDDAAHLLAAGTVNTVTDFIVVSLPVLVVFQVRELSRRQFVIINVLFAFGYLATAAGAVRTFFTWLMTTAPDFDVSWHAQLVWLSSTIELDIGIVRIFPSALATPFPSFIGPRRMR